MVYPLYQIYNYRLSELAKRTRYTETIQEWLWSQETGFNLIRQRKKKKKEKKEKEKQEKFYTKLYFLI